MTDMTQAGMVRFHQRYDLKQRLLYAASLSASLVLSAVMLAHGTLTGGGLQWFTIAFFPLFIGAWWVAQEFIVRWRDGRLPMSEDDAPNGVRIANAGFLFSVALMACLLGGQTVATLATFGYAVTDWVPRATMVACGVALICLGNVWPRLPTPRARAARAAKEMKINRLWGWVMVLQGLGLVLLGPFLPLAYPVLRSLLRHG